MCRHRDGRWQVANSGAEPPVGPTGSSRMKEIRSVIFATGPQGRKCTETQRYRLNVASTAFVYVSRIPLILARSGRDVNERRVSNILSGKAYRVKQGVYGTCRRFTIHHPLEFRGPFLRT